MRCAISLPQFFEDGAFDPATFTAFVRRAEELGYHSGWTQEQVLGPGPNLGPIELMTYAAACSERLRLGCAVFVSPLHNPVHFAKNLATLDQLSRGRLEVGIGTGGRGRMFSAFAVDPDRLVTRFTEGLNLMKKLWTSPRVSFDGQFWQLTDATMEPKPFQKPYPPVWFGGRHPAALRRAVRHGDGFFGAGSSTTADFAGQVEIVREELAATGRDPGGFGLAKRVYIVVDDDPARAAEQALAGLSVIYGDRGGRDRQQAAVSGTPEDCVRGVREVAEAGAGLILFTPLTDPAGQMERLAAEVMPHLG